MPNEINSTVANHHHSGLIVEVGWIVAGKLDDIDLQAVHEARDQVRQYLADLLPKFHWQMPLLVRDEWTSDLQVEPITLLEYAVTERNIKRWDYALIITGSDLISHYRAEAVAALSRTLESAAISTSRIDPRSQRVEVNREDRLRLMRQRIYSLAVHAIGHFCGLDHSSEPSNFMYEQHSMEDLDRQARFEEDQLAVVDAELTETADRRLEESQTDPGPTTLFYAKAVWLNRAEIMDAIGEAKAWQFPYRLSRLTTAAMSALLILLMTAEVWELGMSQSVAAVALLSLASIVTTTLYILIRQGLFIRRRQPKLSEQVVLTNVATISIVSIGMVTTYLLLWFISLLVCLLLFDSTVVGNWSASINEIKWSHYCVLASFIASLGIFIGALGASFEQQHYFRHITFVDEEI